MADQARCIAAQVGRGLYGFSVDDVQEVIAMRSLTRAFHAPPGLAGVTNLRGDVLPVIDSAVLLGEQRDSHIAWTHGFSDPGGSARIIVVREGSGSRRRAGVWVDELRGLRDLPSDGLSEPPSTLAEAVQGIIAGIIPSPPPCALLTVSALLDSPLLAFS